MFFGRSTYDLVFSQGITQLDVFSRTTQVMCFLAVDTGLHFLRAESCIERIILMRNLRECVF